MTIAIDGVPVSGSTGKVTFSRNRYGAYTRRRVKPVNPNSVRQVAARGYFSSAVAYWWNTLDNAARAAWDAWASTTPWLNKAGQTVNLSGQAAFIRQFTFISQSQVPTPGTIGVPTVPAIGAINVNPSLLHVVYDISAASWQITGFADPLWNTWQDSNADSYMSVRLSPPQSPGRTFKPNRMRQMPYTVACQTPSVGAFELNSDVPPAEMPWSLAITGGEFVWLSFRAFAKTTRQISSEIVIGPIVTTAVA